MRCNRKTACLAVTPLREMFDGLNITEIWQLRRREKSKVKSTKVKNKIVMYSQSIYYALQFKVF